MSRVLVAVSLVLVGIGADAVELYRDFPERVKSDERYVIYSHGFIVEGTDPRPEHPQFGTYEFPAIKQALFEDGGFNLIAHHRPADTDIGEYVDTLASWIEELLEGGVPPSRITLIGFSRGAVLTAYASGRYEQVGLNTALMAICSDGAIRGGPPLALGGNFLSMYETSDAVGTCESLADGSPKLTSFREIAISTGRSHGAFFKPLPEWVQPLKEWISETNR
jgi:pimeloyl-ACP methyl ester carboxylesterase